MIINLFMQLRWLVIIFLDILHFCEIRFPVVAVVHYMVIRYYVLKILKYSIRKYFKSM